MSQIEAETTSDEPIVSPPPQPRRSRRFAVLTYAVTLAASIAIMFAILGSHQDASAAIASLEKVLQAAEKPLDRTYEVSVVEQESNGRLSRRRWQAPRRSRPKEEVDGATLSVRGANQYVLTVSLRSGLKRMSGCDGKVSWAFREDGPVHVSGDLSRFRGGIPGHQQDIPFLNLHSHLEQLQSDYDVELLEEPPTATGGNGLTQLRGVRKSNEIRGPREIILWFAPNDGTIHRMRLDGLPRARGGPAAVTLELQDQSQLPLDYFSHAAHHEPSKRIQYE
ncbi:hypothetical protein CEE69_17680 [Rhodopirellula bahusiensis]|uniref:DUF2092 domain-containing protein n=2 Tax=Rhodopirellula bahusiensis TaxID=2014065 RepID=A0A2G1W531_9BACT|nr:hypothetical protein CEE69_17680 [Rhodopirellula bahusiensis]